ncbi:MAG: InlB B-repeat-containing protein, partial [Coriobacteriales bacterium]|nr:InlB B-repeat-containing protein [Coriobacteriales bacterium]
SDTQGTITNTANIYIKQRGGEETPAPGPGGNTDGTTLTEPKRTVTYDANGATSGMAPVEDNSPYDSRSTVTVLGQNDLEREGYLFVGWSELPMSHGQVWQPGDTFEIDHNVDLYAVWLARPGQISKTSSSGGYVPGRGIDFAITTTLPGDLAGYESIRLEDAYPTDMLGFMQGSAAVTIGGANVPFTLKEWTDGTTGLGYVSTTVLASDLLGHEGQELRLVMAFTASDEATGSLVNTGMVYVTPRSGGEKEAGKIVTPGILELPNYLLTVISGSGGGRYLEGETAKIMADPPAEGKVFDRWVVVEGDETGTTSEPDGSSAGGISGLSVSILSSDLILEEHSISTTLVMPAHDVNVEATYKDAEPNPIVTAPDKSGSGGSSPGTGDSTGRLMAFGMFMFVVGDILVFRWLYKKMRRTRRKLLP